MPTLLLDGKYATGFYTGRPRVQYPFRANRDYTSIVVERRWVQSLATFSPGRVGVDGDPAYSNTYLINETDPEPTGIGDVVFVMRTFARVPLQQTEPGSLMVSFPQPPAEAHQVNIYDTGFGLYDSGTTGYYFGNRLFARDKLFGAMTACTGEATSGSDKRLTITGHGFTTGMQIACVNTTSFSSSSAITVFDNGTSLGQWAYVDANTIDLKGLSAISGWTSNSFGGNPVLYSTDPRPVRCNRVTDFYLPGVTPGVSVAADIPLPSYTGNSIALLTTFIAGTGTINYEVGELAQWRDSPILARTVTTLNAALL